MIVLEEHLGSRRIKQDIERWYQGTVITIKDVRPDTNIEDESIASLLHHLKNSTFVTINYTDFWHVIPAYHGYCVICLKLPQERSLEVPVILRAVLRLPEYSTKRLRMGCVISWSNGVVNDYCI